MSFSRPPEDLDAWPGITLKELAPLLILIVGVLVAIVVGASMVSSGSSDPFAIFSIGVGILPWQ